MFFLIGHRGVGKTSLSKGLDQSVDLDEWISRDFDISKIFNEKGEEHFREIERESLDKILSDKKYKFISLGAGFDLKKYKFPKEAKFVWIQRNSDNVGRVFLNRPRLNEELSPLEEFNKRKKERDPVFKEFSDFDLALEEGDFSNEEPLKVLKGLLKNKLVSKSRGYFTPSKLLELEMFVGNVELRTDLFNKDEILSKISNSNHKYKSILVSVRSIEGLDLDFLSSVVKSGALIDLPLEYEESKRLIRNFPIDKAFYSLHKKRDLDQIKKIISESAHHLKWAPLIDEMEELYRYDTLPVERVSFLPRSSNMNGEFKWYRLLRSNKVEFFRYGLTENMDQPLYLESFDFRRENVGAVVGENTLLSWSPAFHRSFFFQSFGSSYLNIPCSRGGFNKKFIEFIKARGVRYLSVTSPFKKEAGALVGLPSCNTLDLKETRGLDTDQKAIDQWSENIKQKGFKKILIWGSGAMGRAFKEKLKDIAVIMSSRSDGSKAYPVAFEAVIWASGPTSDWPNCIVEQKSSLRAIYDLDYKEESKGRFLALETGALYISGRTFFEVQAEIQRVFFQGDQ